MSFKAKFAALLTGGELRPGLYGELLDLPDCDVNAAPVEGEPSLMLLAVATQNADLVRKALAKNGDPNLKVCSMSVAAMASRALYEPPGGKSREAFAEAIAVYKLLRAAGMKPDADEASPIVFLLDTGGLADADHVCRLIEELGFPADFSATVNAGGHCAYVPCIASSWSIFARAIERANIFDATQPQWEAFVRLGNVMLDHGVAPTTANGGPVLPHLRIAAAEAGKDIMRPLFERIERDGDKLVLGALAKIGVVAPTEATLARLSAAEKRAVANALRKLAEKIAPGDEDE